MTYSKKLSCFFFFNAFGIFVLYLPSFYFVKIFDNVIKFLFLKEFFYISFIKHLMFLSNKLSVCFFFKLRMRGLGFSMRSISDTLYYFFFNYTNYFYFYSPKLLLISVYKKRMLY